MCDPGPFEVHTNFTGTLNRVYHLGLSNLAVPAPMSGTGLAPLEVLSALFLDPERLRPAYTASHVTEEAAAQLARPAKSLRRYGVDSERAAAQGGTATIGDETEDNDSA